MTAGIQRHAHDGVTGLADGHGHCHIGLGTGMRLHIGIAAAEELLGTLDGQCLDLIDIDTAAVVTLSGISLCIFIRKHSAHSHHAGCRYDVLGSDQLDIALLSLVFLPDSCTDLRVCRLNKIHDFLNHNFVSSPSSAPELVVPNGELQARSSIILI